MSCVVCGGEVREAHYANAWERARKLYPCCSDACAARFDPDVHWLPAVRPKPADGPEEARLLSAARLRIKDGDRPSLVVRDMLIAGVGLPGVRKLLVDGALSADAQDKVVKRLNVLGAISGVLTGRWRFHERRSKQDPKQLDAATADLEAWRARFG